MNSRLGAVMQELCGVFSLSLFTRGERWLLFFITLGGMLARVPLLSRPMVHDEAYTYVAFASRPLLAVISDYHLPNNHIFHSLLVHFVTEWLGAHPWTVRLPAFLAAALCIPVLALLGARMYSPQAGLLAAAILAGLPVQALYATNARGYSLYTFFTLALFLLAQALVHRPALSLWVSMSIVAGLGFWTVPFMVYPFAGVMLWLALMLWEHEERSFGRWVRNDVPRLIGLALGTAFLAVLVYLPVILWGTGWRSLVGNGFVQPLEWRDLFPAGLVRLQETADEWTLGLPAWVGRGISTGALVAILFHSRFSRERFSPLFIALLSAFLVWSIQRGNPMARLWTYLIPLWVLEGAVGWWQIWVHLRQRLPRLFHFEGVAAMGLLVVLSAFSLRAFPLHVGEIQQVANLLIKEDAGQFFVAVGTPDDAPLWFYLMEAGAGRERFESKRMNSPKVIFVVVRPSEGQTPQSVLVERGLDETFCPTHQRVLWKVVGGLQVYRCERGN